MNRAAFLTLYIIIALFFSGALATPWTISAMTLAFGQKGVIALLNPIFMLTFLLPIVLIVITHMRGKRIGNSKLVRFPIAALGLALLPLPIGLLVKLFPGAGSGNPIGLFGLYFILFISTASVLGPLILHTICCVVGGKRDPVPATSIATNRNA